MTRLWDKGGELDARVLAYTAGEDHALDERLVAHDIRASIAHAEMLAQQGLLAARQRRRLAAGQRRLLGRLRSAAVLLQADAARCP